MAGVFVGAPINGMLADRFVVFSINSMLSESCVGSQLASGDLTFNTFL